jgi:glucosamine--fructose-6-phosphate aminotransferase (isomerizing)
MGVDSTVLAVSQSGETADVLKAVDHARFRAATVIGLTNVLGSTLTRVTRAYLCQNSGPEIGVAATKTFTAQVMVLTKLALKLAKFRGKLSQDEMDTFNDNLAQISELAGRVIETQEDKVKHIAKKYKNKPVFYFLGRGVNVATAYEGRLKLLEVACVPSIAYPAGESKHGPISLAEEDFPVIFVCPPEKSFKTIVGNVLEMQARGAKTIGIIEENNKDAAELFDDYVEIPFGVPEIFSCMLNVIPLQLLAYYMAVERQLDPDKPRNLAKSVTVL